MGREEQIIRHYRILNQLKTRYGVTITQLAQDLEVSKKTISRDIRALEYSGYPIYDFWEGSEKRWKLVDEFQKPLDIRFTLSEHLSLYFCQKLLKPLNGTVLEKPIKSVFEKIKAGITSERLKHFEELTNIITIEHSSFKNYEKYNDIINTVREAIIEKQSLKIKYYSLYRDKETTRTIDPYQLWYQENALYLIGYCHLREEIRLFAIDRIRNIKTLSKKFTIKPEYSSEEYRQGFFGVRKGIEKFNVKIHIMPPWSTWVKERMWHTSQNVVENKDNSIIITFQLTELEAIKRWILGFGSSAIVLEPVNLCEMIEQESKKLLKNYQV